VRHVLTLNGAIMRITAANASGLAFRAYPDYKQAVCGVSGAPPVKATGIRQEIVMETDDTVPPRAVAPPDFNNLLAVLRRERPARPTLFEFFLNEPLHVRLAGAGVPGDDPDRVKIQAFRNAGYDYVTAMVPGFGFPKEAVARAQTISLNDGAVITDRAAFEAYPWVDPDAADYASLDRLAALLPEGMRLIVHGPGGVLENVIALTGYETLCFLSCDDEPLVANIFDAVGARLLRYYERAVTHPAVGAIIGNDDWGFKSQTMLAPADMRRYVFPWHERIVAAAHAAGKPAILHSCGELVDVMDDVIDGIGYDAKHSYEDIILPVEAAYDRYHKRIAILGGIDLDFVCRAGPDAVYARAVGLLDRTAAEGAYALGTGNSVPEYVPDANYFALLRACLARR